MSDWRPTLDHPLAGTRKAVERIMSFCDPVPGTEETIRMAIEDATAVSMLLGAVQTTMLTLRAYLDRGTEPDWEALRQEVEHAFEWATGIWRGDEDAARR